MINETARRSGARYGHLRDRFDDGLSRGHLQVWRDRTPSRVPHNTAEVQLSEGVEIPLRYDRTHLEIRERLVHIAGEEKPLPIRELVLASLQQPAWSEFFAGILRQGGLVTEAPLQKPA